MSYFHRLRLDCCSLDLLLFCCTQLFSSERKRTIIHIFISWKNEIRINMQHLWLNYGIHFLQMQLQHLN